MISKAELHRWAQNEGLRFDQIERDYAILWILAGLSKNLAGSDAWIFKGGTCLRHCYFQGFRFSEDIDFTCQPYDNPLEDSVALLNEVVRWVYDVSGLFVEVGRIRTSSDEVQTEILLPYTRGETERRSLASIKVHMTFDEPILTAPAFCRLTPRYSDLVPFSIYSYSLLEVYAEKMRALLQQQAKWPRPRDLYDLWYLIEQAQLTVEWSDIHPLFVKKCQARQIEPDIQGLISDQLYQSNKEAWQSRLEPLMASIPDFATVWQTWNRQCRKWLHTS